MVAVDSLWRHPDFAKLWAAQTISLLGSQVTFLALPLTAIFLLDATPAQLGVVTALGALPDLVAGLHAGALVDRRRRRPLLIAADLGRALILASIPVAWLTDRLSMPLLYAVALGAGLLALVFDVAYQAFLPAIVPRDRLVDGNAKLELSRTAAEVGGPGLGGWLVGAFSAPVAIALDALSYLGSALLIAAIRAKEAALPSIPSGRRLRSEIADGLRVVFADPRLRAVAGCRALLGFFNAMLEAVFVLFLARTLRLDPVSIGIVFAVGGAGFLVGSLLPERLAGRLGFGPTTVLALALVGIADLLVPLAGSATVAAVPLLIAAQFLFGLGLTVFNVNQASLRQAVVPDDLQGRAAATVRVLGAGPIPLGALAGGLLGGAIGLPETLLLAVGGELLAALWLWRSPVRRLRSLPFEPDAVVAATG